LITSTVIALLNRTLTQEYTTTKMSTQQQAMIMDTLLTLKRTLKRKAYG
jgi:hypothetical protein